uniref:Uncharacterized protein n=1 Tax=Panagrolaimus sp. PS1159 TaxID=55785 RepID=A0AC35FM65_9BILA
MSSFGFFYFLLIFVGTSFGNSLNENFEDQSKAIGISKFGYFYNGNLAEPFSENDENLMEVSQQWISQPLDHFNATEEKTWEQRYWNNSNFFEQNSTIFLIIGGDSTINEKWISNPNVTYLKWAKKMKAQVFLLEHRFYGESQPAEDLSIENLKYLTSKQALKDIENFIQIKKDEYKNSKWITLGGSYGGTLSAWFREKYPELTVGAVGSSAPLHIKTNFFEYLQVVQRSLFYYDPKCGQNIKTVFSDIFSSFYSSQKTSQLNTIFKLSNVLTNSKDSFYKDSQVFFSSILSTFKTAIQFDGINANFNQNGFGIENVCEIMINGTDLKENLKNVFSYMNPNNDIIDSDYLKDIENLQNVSFDGNIYSDMRAWLWQSCTEFGYFQTTDLGKNIFGSTVSIDFYIDLCTDVFGFNRTEIDASIFSTKYSYGELQNFNGTNLALIYGTQDPWHALGYFTMNFNPHGITSFFLNGTSHCADMYPASSSDSSDLISVRDQVERLIFRWIH